MSCAIFIQKNCARPTSSAVASDNEGAVNFAGAAIQTPPMERPAQIKQTCLANLAALSPLLD